MSSGKLTSLLQPLVEDLGYEFVGLQYSGNPKHPVLVIYIDAPDGIAVEDCAKVSREIAAILDVEDPIAGKYRLEVSSPGLDRPLFTLAQFQQFSGEVAQIFLFAPRDGRRKYKGKNPGHRGRQGKNGTGRRGSHAGPGRYRQGASGARLCRLVCRQGLITFLRSR